MQHMPNWLNLENYIQRKTPKNIFTRKLPYLETLFQLSYNIDVRYIHEN